MKLISNTIGNIENPTENDIRRAFTDEWADVPGNIYSLVDNGSAIHSISGAFFKDFSLSMCNEAGIYLKCDYSFKANQIIEYFINFYHGDKEFIKIIEWTEHKKIPLIKKIKELFKKKLRSP